MSSQKYNQYIKKVAQKLKIDSEVLRKKYNGLGNIEEKIYKKYEILSSHNMRDTFITHAIKAEIPIPTIMKYVGQSSWKVMQKYADLDDDHLIEKMDKFSIDKVGQAPSVPAHIANPKRDMKDRQNQKYSVFLAEAIKEGRFDPNDPTKLITNDKRVIRLEESMVERFKHKE